MHSQGSRSRDRTRKRLTNRDGRKQGLRNHRGGSLSSKERSNANWNRRNEKYRSRSSECHYEEIYKRRSEESMKWKNTDSEPEDRKEVNQEHNPKKRHHMAKKIDEK